MEIDLLTKADLEKFRKELITEIKQLFALSPAVTKQKEWLKSKDVMKLLGISPGTLQNFRINGTIPFTKVGGVTYYSYADIQKLFDPKNKNSHTFFPNNKI